MSQKILLVFGTRPEAIKMLPVAKALKSEPDVDVAICVTSQHREMLDQVLAPPSRPSRTRTSQP